MKEKEEIENHISTLLKRKPLSVYGIGYVDALEWVLSDDY